MNGTISKKSVPFYMLIPTKLFLSNSQPSAGRPSA